MLRQAVVATAPVANKQFFNSTSARFAAGGLVRIPPRVSLDANETLYRFVSAPEWAEKAGLPSRVRRKSGDGSTLRDEHIEHVHNFLRSPAGEPLLAEMRKGSWWFRSKYMKHVNALAGNGRNPVALMEWVRAYAAVCYSYSKMDYLLVAQVRPGLTLEAWEAGGRDQVEKVVVNGRVLELDWTAPAASEFQQLFIPGLHENANAEKWMRIHGPYYVGY